jgi:hypothetical protein
MEPIVWIWRFQKFLEIHQLWCFFFLTKSLVYELHSIFLVAKWQKFATQNQIKCYIQVLLKWIPKHIGYVSSLQVINLHSYKLHTQINPSTLCIG